MRTHISLPEDLVREIDELVGARKRSAFIEDAVRRRMVNERQKQALEYIKSLPPLEVPDPSEDGGLSWSGRDGVEWVKNLREQDRLIEERKRAEGEVRYDTARPARVHRVAEP
jgi:hypothetical protein